MSIIDGKRKEKTNSQPVEEQTGFSAYAQERANAAKQAYGKSLIGDPGMAQYLRDQAKDVIDLDVINAGKAQYDADRKAYAQKNVSGNFMGVGMQTGAIQQNLDKPANREGWDGFRDNYTYNMDDTTLNRFYAMYGEDKDKAINYANEYNKLKAQMGAIERQEQYEKTLRDLGLVKDELGEGFNNVSRGVAKTMASIGATAFSPYDVAKGAYDLAAGGGRFSEEFIQGNETPFTTMKTDFQRDVKQAIDEATTLEFGDNKVTQFLGLNGEKVMSNLYSIGYSTLESAVIAGIGGGTGTVLLGTSAGMQTLLQQLQAGVSSEKALAQGLIAGLTEWATERYITLEKVLKAKNMRGLEGKAAVKQYLVNQLKAAGAEGSEELFGSVIDTIADVLINQDSSEIAKLKAEYLAAGDKNPLGHAILDKVGEATSEGLSGAISGLLMSAGGTAVQNAAANATYSRSIAEAQKSGTYQDLLDSINATEYMEGREALTDKTDVKDVRRAYRASAETIETAAIKERLESQGVPIEDSQRFAEIIFDMGNDYATKRSDRNSLSPEAQKVAEEYEKGEANWVRDAKAFQYYYSTNETPQRGITEQGAEVEKQIHAEERQEEIAKITGETVKAESNADIKVTPEETFQSASNAVGISREIISDAYAKRSDEISAERYANATELAFRYGAAGMKLADVVRNIGFSMDSALSEAYKNGQESYVKGLQNNKLRIDRKTANVSYISNEEATKMGVDTVDIASLSDDQNAYIDALDTISKAYGVKMVLFESSGNTKIENGHYDPTTNSIYIDVSSVSGLRKYAMLSTAAHELVHDFRRVTPEAFNALRQFVIDKYYDGSETKFNEAVKRIMQQRKLQGFELGSPDDAVEELVAMSCEKVFDDPNMISRLAETLESKSTPDGETLLDKVIKWFDDLIKRLKSALANLTGIKANPYAEEMSTKDLEHIRDLFVQAAREIQGQGTEVGNDIVKAEPTDKMNVNTEAKAVENRTGLDGASLPLDGTLKDGDDHANKYSVKSSIEAVGFGYEEYFDNGVKKLRMTYNGETISVPTAGLSTKGFINAYKDKILSLINDNEGSPLNRLFAEAIDETMTKAEIEKIKDIYATYLATVQLYADDIDMGKEKLDAIWKWAGTDQFKAIKANSDKQYKVSNDMSSVCVKTEAVLNDISDYQVKSHRGVTPAEVMRIYFFRGSRGYQTPCPFCYVFSHWIRMGQLFETAAAAEDFYKDRLTEKGINDLDYWKAEYKKQAAWAEKNKTLINKAKSDIADIPDIVDEFCSLLPAARAQGNKTAEKKIVDTIDTLNERYVQAFNVVAQSDFKGWIGSCILKIPNDGGVDEATAYGDYKIVDRDILFDLRRVDELVREYPAMARFRTSKGSAGGKAVENYADNKFGEVISGIASNASATAVNTLLDDPKGFAKQFAKAQENAKKQMLRGGNRLFSWSDNRQDTGPDMLLNFIQLQAIGAGVQAYTKQIEGLELVAAMGGYINASLVAKGKGYEVVNGKEQLVFSDRQGINADTTFELNKRYDRAGNILVGMNYNHIRIAMADDRIFFIIPWHRSSLSNRLLNRMMELVGESYIANDTIDKPTDYTAYQEEISFSKHLNGSHEEEKAVASSIVKFWQSLENNNTGLNLGKAIVDGKVVDVKAEGNKVSESQYAYRELRAKVLAGKALTDTEETLVSSDYFLSQIRREMSDVGIDSWGVDDIDFIYPYEYWDHNSTFETADRNGLLYLEYCRRLGVAPKFSGFDKDGKSNPNARFYNLPGYWKTLPDRRMYDREGNYQSVTQVKANKFLLDLITNEGLAERKEEYAKIGLKYETSKRADSKLSEEIYNTVNADMKFYGSKTGEREIGKFKSQQEDLDDYRKLSSGKPIKDYYTEGKNTAMNKTLANLEGTLGVKAKTRPGKSEHAAYEEATKHSTKDLLTTSPTKAEMQTKWSTRDWFNTAEGQELENNNLLIKGIADTIRLPQGVPNLHILENLYAEHPELDYAERIQQNPKGEAVEEFRTLVHSITDPGIIQDIRWFVPEFHSDGKRQLVFKNGRAVFTGESYAKAHLKAINLIRQICDERMEDLTDVGGEDLGIKSNTRFEVEEIENLFNHWNTHAELHDLAAKVFDVAKKLNIAVVATNKGWDAALGVSSLADWGYWHGNASNSSPATDKTGLVVYRLPIFNSRAVTNDYKAQILLHEMIHAVSANLLHAYEKGAHLLSRADLETIETFRNIINETLYVLKDKLHNYHVSGRADTYGFTNIHEFLAEMSNSRFREKIDAISDQHLKQIMAYEASLYPWLRANNLSDYVVSALEKILTDYPMYAYRLVSRSRLYKETSNTPKYSIKDVAPVQPTNNWWKRTHTTEEAMALAKAYGVEMWKVNAESSEESNPTQMKDRNRGTTSTYRKVYGYLGKDYDGRILDASSGAGIGTEVGREMGYDVTDIEPYPGKTYTPQYQDYTALDDAVAAGEVEPFDFIISNAVLNVVPQDQRDGLVTHMGHMLAPGGRMFVHTRAKREIEELGKKAKNVHLGYGEAVESARGSYQYGFNQKELEAYLQDVLGSDYTVTDGRKAFNVNEATALVTKKSSDIKFSFKGTSALDADLDTLNVAEEMEANGYTSEQVRQATGWFKGYDGKWRYEVDDSKARMVDLERKFGEIDSVAEALDEGEYYRIQKFPIHTTLGEILIHPNLYKAYPYLKNTPVIIQDGFSNYGIFSQKAAASTDGETITFNYGAANESPLSIIMHEIQHMIQTKEGFAKGSSPSTFRSPFYVDNLEGVKEAKARYRTLLNQFKNMSAMALSNARMYEYYNKQKRTDKGLTLQYDLNMIRDVEAVAEKGGYLDLLKDFLAAAQDLEVARAEAADKINPVDMYMRTAGEIEARDVQARLDLPEWARKNIRPDIDRTDTIKLSTKDDAEYLELAKDPAKNKVKLQEMVDKAAMAAFPNSKLIQDGKFRKMWHFTTAQFNSFKPGKSKNPQGIKGMFFAPTNNGNISSKFGDGKEYYLNVTNPKVPGAKEHNQYAEKIREMQKGVTDEEEIANINRQFVEETGVDGFVDWMNGWYTVLTPEQIKSADPVTYDDDGNIIPLSERFNESSNDIRYSTKEMDAEYMRLAKAPVKNEKQLHQMVLDYGAQKGYKTLLYHGSKSFGFTVIDVNESDDGISFFATDNTATASTYSGVLAPKLKIRDAKRTTNPDKMTKTLALRAFVSVWKKENGTTPTFDEEKDYDYGDGLEIAEYLAEAMTVCDECTARLRALSKDWNLSDDERFYLDQAMPMDPEALEAIKDLQSRYETPENKRLFAATIDSYEKFLKMDSGNYSGGMYATARGYHKKDLPKIYFESDIRDYLKEYAKLNYIPTWGNYELLGRTDGFLEIEGEGNNWNNIPVPDRMKLKEPSSIGWEWNNGRRVATTREIAEWAKDNFFNGVIIHDLYDNGGQGVGYTKAYGDVYIFFNGNDVKSADPVTYDDQGKVIPLSERFNESNNDIRYSTKDEDVIPYGGKAYSLKEDLSPNEYLASAVLDNIRKPEDRAGLEEYLNRHKELYQETTKLSNEITDLENKLRDSSVLSDSDRESIENRIKTLRKDVRENEKKMWEIVSKPRMQRIIEQQRATIQEYEDEMAKAEEKSDAKIAELRARMDTKVRAEIDKRIAMRKRMLEQQRTQRSRYYYLPRIEKVTKELRKNLEKAPMPFREPIAEFLAALDTRTLDAQGNIKDNKANARKTNLIAALNNMSRIAGTTEEWLNKYNVDFNPEMVTWIDEMVEYLSTNRRLLDYYGDINLNTLSADMLEGVYKMVRSLNTTLKNLTKSYTNKALDISEEAKAVMEFDGKLSHGAADANMAEKIFRWKNAQATTVYQRMGDGGWKMYKLLVKGQSKLAFNEQEIVDFAKSHWRPSDVRNWNKPKNAVAVEISGEKVMMTPAQMMALYATSRDADGLRHLLEGGGFKLLKQSSGNKMVVDVARHMTEMDLANVINALKNYDEKLIKLTEEIQDFIGKTGAEWGNEVSVARFGYEQFGIENYFPLHTVAADKVGTVTRDDADAGKFWSMLNRSFTKERTFKANNALVIDGIFDIFANHMSQMALYNAYALPVLDTARFMNWEVNESVGGKPKVTTLGEVWDKAFGKGEMRNYLTNLLDSIAGAKRMDAFEAFALAGLRLHNRVAVAANFRVAAQQPFSITRAFDELAPKYFAKVPKNIKALQEEMWKNSGIALWKHQGNYDTNIKGSLTSQVMGAETGFGQFKDDLSEKAMWLAEKGDDYTWARIWSACKAYVSETQPTLTDKAYMDAVVSKFEDVVLLTQVVDTPLQKSEWMREKSFWFKMTSSFKSEPTTSYNMLLRSFDRLSEAKQSGKTGAVWAVVKGPMLRAFATYALTSLVNAMVTAVIDAARDDDDYETLLEKLKFAFIGDYRGKNFGQWITEFMGSNVGDSINPIKSLPWFADAFSLIEGYDADRADLTILEEILTQGKAIWTAITKGDMTYKKVFKLVDAFSKVIGIPFANVMRDVTAVWNTVFGRIDSTVKLQISPESKQSGYNTFYYAIQNGETVKAMQIVDEIYSNEISSKTAYTGVTNVIRKAYQDRKIDKEDALDYMLMTNDYFDRGFDRAHIKNQVDGWKQE